jgi:UDP-4-amino-4,6-dideoxy-N-acetyl-beta-L-altrosamine transaminase
MDSTLAINGGKPIRTSILQYGKQTIEQSDKDAIIGVLDENNYLTTGPKVIEFEDKCKEFCGVKYALAVNSGTAALHCATYALNLQKNDEVIVSGISFVASANCIVYCGATPIFCDIENDTMNIDPVKIEALITNKTKAILCVDFAGQLCNYEKIKEIAVKYNLFIIQDAAHSWGTEYNNKFVGNMSDITTLSFHPVKNMTTGEGGMVVTNNEELYNKMKIFRQHGINIDYKERDKTNQLSALMTQVGYNYRIPDILCALGISQLERLAIWIKRRNEIANIYNRYINNFNNEFGNTIIQYLTQKYPSAYHIYVVKLNLHHLKVDRKTIFDAMRAEGIGVNVHYLPIHLHPFYKDNFNTSIGQLPIAESVYESIITLPLYPNMNNDDILDVILALKKVIQYYLL